MLPYLHEYPSPDAKKSANLDLESTDNWHFHLPDLFTYPRDGSVNSWVSDDQYASFDMLIDALSKLGPGAKIAKADLKSAFRTLPMSPDENLGFTADGRFYVNVTMPMGAKVSCATYEKFSTFLECVVKIRAEFDLSRIIWTTLFSGAHRILINASMSRSLLMRSQKSLIYQRQTTRR